MTRVSHWSHLFANLQTGHFTPLDVHQIEEKRWQRLASGGCWLNLKREKTESATTSVELAYSVLSRTKELIDVFWREISKVPLLMCVCVWAQGRKQERERESGREENVFVQYLFTASSNSKHRKKNKKEKRSRRRKHSNALVSSSSMDRTDLRGQPWSERCSRWVTIRVFSTGHCSGDGRAHHVDDDQRTVRRSLRNAKYNVEKNFADVRERASTLWHSHSCVRLLPDESRSPFWQHRRGTEKWCKVVEKTAQDDVSLSWTHH